MGMNEPLIDFTTLYKDYARDVRRFALFLSGDSTAADDIVSETFIRVWSARSRVDLPTVKAYLFAIARNVFLHQKRHSVRHTELTETVTDEPDPQRHAQARKHLRIVLDALQELPEIDRAAVLMRAEDELSYDEIAAALGISSGAVRVKVHRARLFLARRTENL
jgi:RNA polymerase sigma-70 factor (ECF subfamily)